MNREMESQQEVQGESDRERILRDYRHIAIVGLSLDSTRPSHAVAAYLQTEGYEIVPINPLYAGQNVLGKRIYASLNEAREAGEQIEIVDVFRKASDLEPVLLDAIQVGARVLWLQLGIRNAEIGQRASAAGLEFVEDRCTKIEHERYAIT